VVELSPELADEAAERDRRLAALGAARAGVDHLRRAAEAGRADFARADGDVARAAESVVVDYLASVERQWSLVRAEADRLADVLTSGAAVWLSGNPALPVRALAISPEIRSAVKFISDVAAGALSTTLTVPGRHPLTTKIQDWHRRLMADADAELDPPPAGVVPIKRKVAAAALMAAFIGLATLPHLALAQVPPALPVLQQATTHQTSVALTSQGVGTVGTPDQTNYADRRVGCLFNQVAHTGTPSSTLVIDGKDPVSGVYFPLATSASLTADGATYLSAGAGIPAGQAIPAAWRGAVIATAGTITGTLSCWGQG
jgi:hypothetical protein